MINATLRGFIKKELVQTLRDPRMRLVLFGIPIVQTTIFGFALSMEVRNVRLASSFAPNDVVAQRVLERAYTSGWFVPAKVSGHEPFRWIEASQAEVALIAPTGGLTHGVGHGGAQVQALIDATNLLRAQSVEQYLHAILREVALEQKRGEDPPPPASAKISVRMLYNPTQESAIFLIPGLICLILCVVTILLTAMSLAREKEMGTFEMLISAPIKSRDIVLGKMVPFMLLALVDVPLILTVAVVVFDVPIRGPLWQLALGSGFFIFTTVCLGILISTYARNQQQALMGAFMVMMPAVLLSGLFFPLENMPEIMQWVTVANPLRYFVVLLRAVMLKGGDPGVFWPNLAAIAVIGMAVAALSIKRFRQTLN
jgi:ABC-2 type transport system permease protein